MKTDIKNINIHRLKPALRTDIETTVEWDCISHDAWRNTLTNCQQSNLLQCWHYGEAKAEIEGWVPRRGVILHDGKAVGIVQALTKNFLIVSLWRINRGPLWISHKNNLDHHKSFTQYLKKNFGIFKRKILFFAPSARTDEVPTDFYLNAGFKQRSEKGAQSSTLNLSTSVELLQSQLHSKWRNQLKKAERENLSFKLSGDREAFHWMLQRYQEMMEIKNFTGPAPALIKSAYEKGQEGDFIIIKAIYNEEAIAGIVIATHGREATYLIGWSGDEGRKLYATNFLLWNAVLELKKKGFLIFDLGGIDEEKYPDITRFKRRMGGTEYALHGEQTLFL